MVLSCFRASDHFVAGRISSAGRGRFDGILGPKSTFFHILASRPTLIDGAAWPCDAFMAKPTSEATRARPAAKPKVRFEPKEASAEGELEDYNEKLSDISRRLCQGVEAKDERALQWSRLLDASLNFKLPWRDREVRLRVLYHCLYGLADTKVLPSVPTALLTQLCSVEGAETRVEANIESLRISLPEALKQLSTQRHPGAYFLLTCHLGKERLPACQGFPWLTFGVLLLLLGVLCGPNRAERPVAVPSQTWNEVSHFPAVQAGAAQTAAAAPLLLGGALLVTLRRTASSRTQDWSLLLCLGMLSLGAAKSDLRFRHENASFSASCFTSCEGQDAERGSTNLALPLPREPPATCLRTQVINGSSCAVLGCRR
ncbi:unnamed protein product [Symbiodinium sp. CCMP2592]|nr:unnamed protein product [Symbiodinium sp. CCMP2592]